MYARRGSPAPDLTQPPDMPASSDKIVSPRALEQLRTSWRQQDKVVVFTNGCFDLLHRGHIELLREARALGDLLVVGLNSDDSVRALKGAGRPLVPQQDRAQLLAELNSVDYISIFDEISVESTITSILPDILVKGGDYALDQIVGREVVEQNGGRVRTLTFWTDRSTTGLIAKAKELDP
jgi:rfaE bifunctional protein nucleotidyltransferase chain/domain